MSPPTCLPGNYGSPPQPPTYFTEGSSLNPICVTDENEPSPHSHSLVPILLPNKKMKRSKKNPRSMKAQKALSPLAESLIGTIPTEVDTDPRKFWDLVDEFKKPIFLIMYEGTRIVTGCNIVAKEHDCLNPLDPPRGTQSYLLDRHFGENSGMINCFVWWLITLGSNQKEPFYRDLEEHAAAKGDFGMPWERGFERNRPIGTLTRSDASIIDKTSHVDYPAWTKTIPPHDTKVHSVTCLPGKVKIIGLDQGESHSILQKGRGKGIFAAFIIGKKAMEKHVESHLHQYHKYFDKWKKDPVAKVMIWKQMLAVVGDTQDGRLIMFMNMVFGLQPLVYSCGKKVDNIPPYCPVLYKGWCGELFPNPALCILNPQKMDFNKITIPRVRQLFTDTCKFFPTQNWAIDPCQMNQTFLSHALFLY